MASSKVKNSLPLPFIPSHQGRGKVFIPSIRTSLVRRRFTE
jgi:hypothetical protein